MNAQKVRNCDCVNKVRNMFAQKFIHAYLCSVSLDVLLWNARGGDRMFMADCRYCGLFYVFGHEMAFCSVSVPNRFFKNYIFLCN